MESGPGPGETAHPTSPRADGGRIEGPGVRPARRPALRGRAGRLDAAAVARAAGGDPGTVSVGDVRARAGQAAAVELRRRRREPRRHGRGGDVQARRDRQPARGPQPPVRDVPLPAQRAHDAGARLPAAEQPGPREEHRPHASREVGLLARRAHRRARVRDGRHPEQRARAGREDGRHELADRRHPAVRRRSRPAPRRRVDGAGGMGVGREPGTGLPRDRPRCRREARGGGRPLPRRQDSAMGGRRGRAFRHGNLQQLRLVRRRDQPAKVRRAHQADPYEPALVQRQLSQVPRPRGRPALRPAHAHRAVGPPPDLRHQRHRRPLRRPQGRVPRLGPSIIGVRAVGIPPSRRN